MDMDKQKDGEIDSGLNFIDCTTLAMIIYLRDLALKKDTSF